MDEQAKASHGVSGLRRWRFNVDHWQGWERPARSSMEQERAGIRPEQEEAVMEQWTSESRTMSRAISRPSRQSADRSTRTTKSSSQSTMTASMPNVAILAFQSLAEKNISCREKITVLRAVASTRIQQTATARRITTLVDALTTEGST